MKTKPSGQKLRQVRSGLKVIVNEESGQEILMIQTPEGQKISMVDHPAGVEICDSHGNSILLNEAGIQITSAVKIVINASNVEVSTGIFTVNAGMSRFTGVVQADTLVTNAVISASYTPGAGNIM
jgi:hypothetical protein